MTSWNPLRCSGTALPTPLLLMAKIVTIALLFSHERLMALPLQVVFCGAALLLLFNRWPRLSALSMSCAVLIAIAASGDYSGNMEKLFASTLLLAAAGSATFPLAPRLWSVAAWLSLLCAVFGLYPYWAPVALLGFVRWPRELIVIFDGDCGICNRIREWLTRLDFERAFSWQPFQSGIGDRFAISREALEERLHLAADGRISAGFRACKLIILYNPAFYLVLTVVLAAPGEAPWAVWWRRAVMALVLAFFLPLFNPIGERVYDWVARNRHRLSSGGACAIDPGQSLRM